jgi:hypothetical protein
LCGLVLASGLASGGMAPVSNIPVRASTESHREGMTDVAMPFPMILPEPPVFPERDFSVHDHGGIGDGRTLNTHAFARAIAACAAAGGGRVVVPPGRWLTGAIHLRSNINLHLTPGSTIVFSDAPEDYLPAVWVRWGSFECMNYSPLIYARDCDNIAITGHGTIDGNGAGWFNWAPRQTGTAERLHRMSVDNVPVNQRIFATPEDSLRPNFIHPINCRRVLVEGVTILTGPFWTLQFTFCDGVIARNLTIRTTGPNTDGIDIDSSRNVLIEDCDLTTGDDCIVLKSGINEEGRRVDRPTENVVIRRCIARAGHGGFVIGSEMSGGVRNVLVEDCNFIGTVVGVRFKSARGRGGVVENIWCRDLRLANITREAILLTTFYRAWFGSDTGMAPVFRNLHFERIHVEGAHTPIAIEGLPEQPIQNLQFRDFQVLARHGIRAIEALGVQFENISLTVWEAAELMTLTNTRDVTIDNLSHANGPETLIAVNGSSSGIRVKNTNLARLKTPFRLAPDVAVDAVQLAATD